MRTKTIGLLSVGLAMGPAHVFAQAPAPAELTQHTEAVVVPAPEAPPDQFTTGVGAGGSLNTGNTRSIAANAGGQLLLRRSPSQLSVDVLGTLSYADDPEVSGTKYERNAASVIGRARYDLFLSSDDALFIAIAPRRDVNAGLDVRLQNQIGYLRNLYHPSEEHRLWLEAGYDLTYDNFAEITTSSSVPIDSADQDAIDALLDDVDFANGDSVAITRTTTSEPDPDIVHSARVFLGYTNHLTPVASLNFGTDLLYDVQDSKNIRVNGVVDFTSSLSARFKLGVQFRALFDNVPVPGKGKLDTITALQLIYTYDSLAAAAAAEPAAAPCDCTAEVAAAQANCPPPAEPAPVQVQPSTVPDAPAAPPEAAPSEPAPPAVP